MAHKRRIVVHKTEPPPLPEEPEEEQGWGDWLKRTYARYWFAIIVMFVDAMVVLTLADIYEGVAIPLFALVALAAVEVTVYLRLWGAPPWTD